MIFNKLLKKFHGGSSKVYIIIYTLVSVFMYRNTLFLSEDYVIANRDFLGFYNWENLLGIYGGYIYFDNLSYFTYLYLSRKIFFLFYAFFAIIGATPTLSIIILRIFSQIIAGYSTYLLFKYLLRNLRMKYGVKISRRDDLISFFTGFLYMVAPYNLYFVRHTSHLVSISFYPLLFYYTLKSINERKYFLRYSILAALVLSLISGGFRHLIFGGILYLMAMLYSYMVDKNTGLKDVLRNILVFIPLYLLLNAYWILPLFLVIKSGESIGPTYVVSPEVLKLLAQPILDSFLLKKTFLYSGYNVYYLGFGAFSILIYSFIMLMPMVGLFKIKKIPQYRNSILFLTIIYVALLPLTSGYVVVPFYEVIVHYSPSLSEKLKILFRSFPKLLGLQCFVYTSLLGFIFALLAEGIDIEQFFRENVKLLRRPRDIVILMKKTDINEFFKVLLIFWFLTSYILYVGPVFSGDFYGELKLSKYPTDYTQLNMLLNYSGSAKALWIPDIRQEATWSSNPIEDFGKINSITPTYLTTSLEGLQYYDYFFEWLGNRPTVARKYCVLKANSTRDLYKILSGINVRYLVIRKDFQSTLITKKFINTLKFQKNLINIFSSEILEVFEVNYTQYDNEFSLPDFIVLLNDFDQLLSIIMVLPENITIAPIFPHRLFNPIELFLPHNAFIILSPETDFNKIGFNMSYKVIAPYIFSLTNKPDRGWAKASVDDPLHGTWHPYIEGLKIENWQFDYGKGLVFTWIPNVELKMLLDVEESGIYRVFVRYFENKEGGAIKIYLDGDYIQINTKNQTNKFIWREIGSFYLEKGKHELVIENIDGFNAVNLFMLISDDEYRVKRMEAMELLQNTKLAYLFEAERDLFFANLTKIKKFGGEASNGELLELRENGKVWQGIKIIKDGVYRLSLRGEGRFRVEIGNYTFYLKSESLDYIYTPMFYLKSGDYTLKIVSVEESYLDVVWLYPTYTDQTLEQFFNTGERTAEIISFDKITPTLWKVRVNIMKPFVLSFAEAYDPLWEAEVYKDGKLLGTYTPFPLYSVINGFWIDKTGNLEIVIRYKPQYWFKVGVTVSLVWFCLVVLFIFYDWRKKRVVSRLDA